ncbi:protein SMG9 [Lingula anatina]|uniref:Protein SMG9 n=1 Tax=Lingula anatina TaxID=7574 RepID=A0A1S3HPQ0_LINAN|nr:protein SMG9 [Lingula anatina]|eukprot:XP_013388010.1 protein SMG9 [Lingula anatina]
MMADEGPRRRRRRGGRKERERDVSASSTNSASGGIMRPPIILAKPNADRPINDNLRGPDQPRPVVMLKAREDSRPLVTSTNTATHNIPSLLAGEHAPSQPIYQIQKNPTLLDSAHPRLNFTPEMSSSVKVIDEGFQWTENGMEVLTDNTDFFVIGVLGLQGAGKSTIMSLLAGNQPSDEHKSYIFKPQSREVREVCGHQTTGVDMYVTSERTILLDCQPLLSASILDHMVHTEKKYPSEYSTTENCIEMQSLQLMTFMMTVCNVVLVVQDWFTDANLLRLLQTAEMLKPPTPSPSHDIPPDDTPEYYPHIVFLNNKASRQDFGLDSYDEMQKILSKALQHSKLRCKGSLSMTSSNMFPGHSQGQRSEVNLYLLPSMQGTKEQGNILTLLPEYRGYPSFELLMKTLRNQLLSMSRSLITNVTISEKYWFHYANKAWESIKKSQFLSEYNRLLP